MRLHSRMQWVSVTMAGMPNTSPMTQVGTLRPTPGSSSRASKSSGTLQSYLSRSIRIQALISRALLRPSPQGRTISSISSGSAAAKAATFGIWQTDPVPQRSRGHRCTVRQGALPPAAARRARNPAYSPKAGILFSAAQCRWRPAVFIMNLHGGHTLFYHFPARGRRGLRLDSTTDSVYNASSMVPPSNAAKIQKRGRCPLLPHKNLPSHAGAAREHNFLLTKDFERRCMSAAWNEV